MEALYSKVPDILKGYVELVYDLHDNPSIRFLEGLLYGSKFYNTGLQSVLPSEINSDSRSFVFSAPRLESDQCLLLNTSFENEALDELFKMKTTPQPLEPVINFSAVFSAGYYLNCAFDHCDMLYPWNEKLIPVMSATKNGRSSPPT
jgi:hypothetical protein